jgi:hypothetical protein
VASLRAVLVATTTVSSAWAIVIAAFRAIAAFIPTF